MTSPNNLDDLKATINVQDVAASILGQGKRTGKAIMYSVRPEDDTPSFAVYDDGFKDFGSGDSGNVFGLVMQLLDLNFPQAIKWLEDFQGGYSGVTPRPNREPAPETPSEPPSTEWQQALHKALAELATRQDTPQARRARKWLHDRGISNDLIKHFGLLYNPAWLKTTYINPDTGKPAYLAPGIIIPIISDGVIWAMKIRSRVGDFAKALNAQPDRKKNGKPADKYTYFKGSKTKAFFNGDALQPGKTVVITEGEFDAMVAQKALGDDYAAVTLGGASNRIPKRGFDKLRVAPAIYAIFDNDNAGRAAVEELPEALNIQPITLPYGKDITEFVVNHDGQLSGLALVTGGYACWLGGVPDGVRSLLLTVAPTGAPLWERMNAAFITGDLNPAQFTIKQVKDLNLKYGWEFSEATIDRGIAGLTNLFFSKLGIEDCLKTMPKNEDKSRGRKANAYQLDLWEAVKAALMERLYPKQVMKYYPAKGTEEVVLAPMFPEMFAQFDDADTIAEELDERFAQAYEQPEQKKRSHRARYKVNNTQYDWEIHLDDPRSTPLEEAIYHNTPEYRTLFVRAMVAKEADSQRSQAELAGLLGMNDSSVPAVLKRAGIKNEAQHVEKQVRSAHGLAQKVRIQSCKVKGWAEKIIAVHDYRGTSEQTYLHNDVEFNENFIAEALDKGAKVMIKYRVASKQHIVREEPYPTEEEMLAEEAESAVTEERSPAATTSNSENQTVVRNEPENPEGYDPEWVKAQLELALHLMDRGYSTQSTLQELLELLLDCPLPYAPSDPVLGG